MGNYIEASLHADDDTRRTRARADNKRMMTRR